MAMDGILRKLWYRAHRLRSRIYAPSVDQLEPRELQALVVNKFVVNVSPALLPNSGKFVPVHVYGEIATTRPATPNGFFFTTDEYGSDEPGGPIKLGPALPYYNFYESSFSFTIYLQAKGSSNTQDGRHYDIFVGAKDADDSGGVTVAVYVPKVYSAHPAKLKA